MPVIIYASARRHGILDSEIRETLAFPFVCYRIVPRIEPDAVIWRMIGGPDGGPYVEVLVEDLDDDQHVFHAMLLTAGVAREVYEVTFGAVDFLADVHHQQRRSVEE